LIPVQAFGQQPAAQNGGEQGDATAAEETGVDASEKPPPAKNYLNINRPSPYIYIF
jgi:hypothetical protein